MRTRKKIEIRVYRNKIKNQELDWTEKELNNLSNRILKLRDDQIGALLNLTGLNFNFEDIKKVVEEIKDNGVQSSHLDILILEANSKEELLWWLNYFEEASNK